MGSGSKSSGTSKSAPTVLPHQQQFINQYQKEYMPAALGKPTTFGKMQEQLARDASARASAQAQEQTMQMAGQAGVGAPEVASLQRGINESAVQQTIQQVLQARKEYALMAMKMIAGQPLYAQTSTSKQKATGWSVL
jgi:hypothetical protein